MIWLGICFMAVGIFLFLFVMAKNKYEVLVQVGLLIFVIGVIIALVGVFIPYF